jgi:hypothetical protein
MEACGKNENKAVLNFEIAGFRRGVVEAFALIGCYVV